MLNVSSFYLLPLLLLFLFILTQIKVFPFMVNRQLYISLNLIKCGPLNLIIAGLYCMLSTMESTSITHCSSQQPL